MMFHPAISITEQIADHLADLVVCNELPGGARIQELKVARELPVSRGSVRESLLILERRYLIEIVPRRGAVVNELFADEAIELVDTLLGYQHRLHRLIREALQQNGNPTSNRLSTNGHSRKRVSAD